MIKCKAMSDQSLYVTAYGEILPCCFLHKGSPLNDDSVEISKDKNFVNLTADWNTNNTNTICFVTCDTDNKNNIKNMKNFDDQWRIKDIDL
jgi:uncharacterized GH25 family protein